MTGSRVWNDVMIGSRGRSTVIRRGRVTQTAAAAKWSDWMKSIVTSALRSVIGKQLTNRMTTG